ncbi:MAG: Crp/Fnr family transcriptional regulator [Chitinophagaceae bacterium]|nr:Crp/Fnr family transcriptional regulator [Chitinophagaceae bacterium]MBP6478542.1 Crp/Fnr family transcriptional regulator [Chitinophagaceae bacterium]MBP7108937.1 Crp/Fnr family transcriptional regulator [Chitinophagaceae bacterium]MBP7314251.1 Crp/Fnr family transcriptional regulator [Chitinophagaceae bacterium]HQV56225.1 Crp/Fnr family transcriptional regulator [Chitinophagaceae bacterium]
MSDKTKLWYLENFNLLSSLQMKEMEELSKMTTMRSCIKNQIIYFTDDPSDKIYFLKKGKVKLSRYAADGREIIVAFLGPGEIFGELAISGQHQRVETAEATEESLICILSVPQMEMMLEKNPKFNLSVTKLIGLRLQKVESRLASLIFKSSDQRIHSFIYDAAIEHGKKTEQGVEVYLRLTHENIAKLTATARPTVSAVFSDLEKRNVIEYNRKRILVKDMNALK